MYQGDIALIRSGPGSVNPLVNLSFRIIGRCGDGCRPVVVASAHI